MDRSEIAKAIVTVTKKEGQGVLVAGNLILTAAHCIDFSCEGGMALGDYYIEEIDTVHGKFKVGPWAVEPVSDIAVLGPLDSQAFPRESDSFVCDFCDRVKPVPISTRKRSPFEDFPAYIHNHKRTWVRARARLCGAIDGQFLWVEADEQLEGGTSGGPVLDDFGELLGVASNFSIVTQTLPQSCGRIPRPHLTVPAWIWHRILTAESGE